LAKIKFDYDLIIIGSGPAGYPAAIAVAGAGLNVAIIEEGAFGGEAANYYDVPVSALAHAATTYDSAKKGARFGISSNTLRFNFPAILNYQQDVTKQVATGQNKQLLEKLGIKIFHAQGHFLSPHLVSAGRRQLTAKNFLIATGSHPLVPDIKNLESIGYLTPRELVNLRRLPKSIFVVGGGATGVEIAQIFASFGSKVIIAETSANLLPREEPEAGQLLGKIFDDQYGITVLTKSEVVAIDSKNGQKQIIFKRGGEEKSVTADEIVITTGQQPNIDLGLGNAGVRFNSDGIEVNEFLQTSMRHIYAAGDCIGGKISTTKAQFESQTVSHNILYRTRQEVHYNGLPYFTYTYPQIASVGLTESEAKAQGISIQTALSPLSLTMRSHVDDFKDGLVKIVANRRGKLLGACVMSPEAGSMIHELALANRYDLLASDLAEAPHAHLSWNEAIRQAASKIE